MQYGTYCTERVTHLARERFFWSQMASDIEFYVSKKCRCLIQRKPHRELQAPMQSISSSSPLEIVSLDFVHLETASGGYEYILTIVDHFTRYLQAYATRNKSALTAARILYNDYIPRFGIPANILHDRGKEFVNKIFQELNRLCGIRNLRTTPYHPMSNGQCERMNGTILRMLKTLEESQKSRWKDHLNKVVHAYNCSKNSTTGFTPFYLLFARNPRLPIDTLLPSEDKEQRGFSVDWKTAMQDAYRIVLQQSEQRKAADRKRRNAKNVSKSIAPGDRVLLRNVTPRGGPGKLRSHWEQKVYKVLSSVGDTGVVYQIQLEDAKGRIKTLHRNLLLPCHELLTKLDEAIKPKSKNTNRTAETPDDLLEETPEIESRSDEEDENFEFLEPTQTDSLLHTLTEAPEKENCNLESAETVEAPVVTADSPVVTVKQTDYPSGDTETISYKGSENSDEEEDERDEEEDERDGEETERQLM